MPASVQGVGMALPNLAFSLIMRSVQKMPASPQAPSRQSGGNKPPTPPPASTRYVDVKA